jgi:hypothetical protein
MKSASERMSGLLARTQLFDRLDISEEVSEVERTVVPSRLEEDGLSCILYHAVQLPAALACERFELDEGRAYLGLYQGCQMVYFQTKNPNSGKFWGALDCKLLIYCMAIWNILRTFGIFYDHLVQFVFIWYISSCFCILHQ